MPNPSAESSQASAYLLSVLKKFEFISRRMVTVALITARVYEIADGVVSPDALVTTPIVAQITVAPRNVINDLFIFSLLKLVGKGRTTLVIIRPVNPGRY